MNKQNNETNKIRDMGRKAEHERQRELQKLVEETAEHTAEKTCKKLSKHFEKEMKKINNRLDKLEKGSVLPDDPDRDEDGFYQLRRR